MIDTSPRRLSNIYPIHTETYQKIAGNSRCAITPTAGSAAQPFFPPTNPPVTGHSQKRPGTTTTKMDMFVPSPGLFTQFGASPPSSIYDQDRPESNMFCGSSMFSNTSGDSVISEEIGGLDENIEDSSLATFLTPDMMNTLQSTTEKTSQDFIWSSKPENEIPAPTGVDSLGPTPTLAQLNMEPDMTFVNEILNLEQDDSKLSYSGLDFLCNDIGDLSNQSCFTNVSTNSTKVAPVFVSSSPTSNRRAETASSTQVDQRNFQNVGNSYMRNNSSLKSNFPPRASQPTVIGVVTPVIKPEPEVSVTSEKTDSGLDKLKTQSPNLHKLLSLSKQPQTVVKSEYLGQTDLGVSKMGGNLSVTDYPAQIVPTSSASKRTYAGAVKVEPSSPKATHGPLKKDESTEEKWKDIENFIHNPDQEQPTKKRRRFDSGSSSHMSDDEDDDDDDASYYGGNNGDDDSDDDYSDIDADLTHISPSECESLVPTGKKPKQYFWQYNVQSKGPKGTRLKLTVESPSDPHVLNDFEDPVFDECNTAIAGIRHGGKARKGDGNEITPNPRKLFMIGHQLMRLTRQINACQLGADVPAAKRNESRKEKNKLASRACRLKKKAQHEANKIKLYGLEQEHSQLNSVLRYIWPSLRDKAKVILGQADKSSVPSVSAPLSSTLESQISQNLKSMIAGHTTDYVNSVILKVESGDNSGGLNIRKSRKT